MTAWPSATLSRYVLRQMLRRPGRTLLTLLGIGLGVATVVAVTMTAQATHSAYRDMFTTVTGRASLEVVGAGLGGFDEHLAQRLGQVRGVKAAVPVIQSTAALVGNAGPMPVLVLGIDPARDTAARDYVVQAGRLLQATDTLPASPGLLLEAGFARAGGYAVGQPASLWTPTGRVTLSIVGLLEPRGAATFNGGAVAFLTLPTAQRIFALPHQINSVQIVLADGADASSVEAALRAQLPAGLQVQAPSARGERARDALYALEQCLAGASFVTLVAGAFVILNTFLINLTERRRQLAMLRALGATRRQLTALLVREALLLGLAGTFLGIAGGYGLAVGIAAVMAKILGSVTLPEVHLASESLLLGVLFGPGMALVATWVPARRAARRAPLDDLLARGSPSTEDRHRWPAFLGLVLIGVHLLCMLGLGQGWLEPSLLAPTMPVGVVGCVLALPLVIQPLIRLVALLLKRPLGLEGRLALRELQRRPGRVSLTVGILAIALFVGIGVGHALLASAADCRDWVDHVIGSDFYIRGTQPDGAYAITMAVLPEQLEDDLARLDGVGRVDKLNWILARTQGERVVVIAYTFAPRRSPSIQLSGGDPQEILRRLLEGEVVIGTALAQRLALAVGERIVLETPSGPRSFPIAGLANEYTINGMALYMDWQAARKLFPMKGVHVFALTAREGRGGALAANLKAFCTQGQLLLQSGPELRQYIDQAVDRFAGLIWALLALIFVVASLAIVNTLTMNVLEQTRELGVLRALGLKRGQLGKLVLSQALALGLISLVPGTVVGLLMAYLFNLLQHLLLAHALPFHIDLGLVVICLGLAMLVSVLAALLPARRAARLQVVNALQYE